MSSIKGNNAVSIMLSDYTPVTAVEKVDRENYVRFGVDNLFPQYIRGLAETSPIHGSLCVSIGDMIAGKGLNAGVNQGRVDALGVYDVYYACSHDLKKFGGFYVEVIYSRDYQSIAKLNHIPFEECRIAVEGEDEEVTGVYHSNDWANPRKKKNKPTFIPKYQPLRAQVEPRQIYWCFDHTSGQVYPRPDYWSSVNYIELSKQIGIYHVNQISNGLMPSFIVSMFQGAPEPDTQMQIKRDWEDKLSGAKNAGKFIMTFNERDTPKPDIVPFPLSDADKQYQFLADSARNEILIGHRITTPLIFGVRGEGTGFGSNVDEMTIGLKIFNNQVIEPRQRKLATSFEEILSFEMESIEITVIPNTPIDMPTAEVKSQEGAVTDSTQPNTGVAAVADVNVAATALNGAQIASLVDILIQAATGVLPVTSAKGVVQASFPTLSQSQIDTIFTGIVAGSVDPNAVAMEALKTTMMELSKKKSTRPNVAELDSVVDDCIALGHDLPDDWVLIDEFPVEYDSDDDHTNEVEALNAVNLVSTGTARPNAVSSQDRRIDGRVFYTRYKYDGNVHPNTRDFCRAMLRADKLYRKEDIEMMGKKVVNKGWGPYGADTYSVWLWVGGGNCTHRWLKQTFASAKGFGLDLTNTDVKTASDAIVKKSGYKVRNHPNIGKKPQDMKYHGFLPDNPVWGRNGTAYKND